MCLSLSLWIFSVSLSLFSLSRTLWVCQCVSLSLSLEGGLPLISCRSENVVSHLEVSKRRLIGVNMPVSGLPSSSSDWMESWPTCFSLDVLESSWSHDRHSSCVDFFSRRPCHHCNFSTRPLTSHIQEEIKPPSQVRRDRKRAEEKESKSWSSKCSRSF